MLPGAALEPGLEWVASAFSVTTLLAEVKESTRRISELVGAVTSYSQMDRASLQDVVVTDGLESSLFCTNLVDNAVDAMGGAGTLEVVTWADEDAVVVEIVDSGPGMPAHVAARAFEAFFTTKDVGRGTGLGLDIAQRIVVERHGGSITIDSQPGRTVLRVRLPVRTPGRT